MSRANNGKTVGKLGVALWKRVGLAWVGLITAGCSTVLEDGYKPRALDASPEARKSYYASPFTESAEAGNKENGPGLHAGGR